MVVIILIVLVLGFVGYIIFDKVMLTDKENKNTTTTNKGNVKTLW